MPWADINTRASEYFDPSYWPQDTPFLDPSRTNLPELEAVMALWCSRQARGLSAFEFLPSLRKGKMRAAAEEETSDFVEEQDLVRGYC